MAGKESIPDARIVASAKINMINYTLKRSTRARSLRLAVYPDGDIVVTSPYFFGLAAIERFVLQHAGWISEKIEKSKSRLVLHIDRREISMHKKYAASIARARCEYFADIYGVTYKKITIRAPKTRWGSCSRAGNLSFHYKIALLPARLVDYIIVHEICHLIEFNHSKAFWAHVAKTIPDHKIFRKELHTVVTRYA